MPPFSEDFLLQAVRNEAASRDIYAKLADKIEAGGKAVLNRMSSEEDTHFRILSKRYLDIYGFEPVVSETSADTAPDFSFIEKSVFSHTDEIEALTLCLGAEIDAINLYSKQMEAARSRSDMRLLKSLIRFEKRHRKNLEKLIGRAKHQGEA